MKETFDEEFILQLLKISTKDKRYLEIMVQFLKPEFLPTDDYRKVWKSIITEFNLSDNNSLPTLPVLKQLFRKDIDVLEILSNIKEVKVEDDSDILRNLEEFLRQNMFAQFYNEIGDLYNKNKKDLAYKAFVSKATEFTNFSLKTKTLEKVFEDFNKRVVEREINKINGSKRVRIPTGFDEFDSLTNGGFETGELILIVGDSGVGKSFCGNHLGVNAARRGYHVYHAQGEGTREQVMGRYDSAWSGTKYFDVKENNINDKKFASIRRVLDNVSGEIHVEAFEKFNSKTVVDLRNSVRELKKKYDIKYAVIDYMDLFDPGDGQVYGPNLERHRQQKVAKMLKDLAVEENIVVVTFTQASSISPDDLNDPNFVITRFHMAEDKGKVRPADVLITINQTRDEKKSQIARFYIDKTREHVGNAIIYFYQNLKFSRFYDRKRTINEFFRLNENE